MKRIFTLAIVAILGLWTFVHKANAQCTYQVKLYDSFGDGWNGNNIDIKSGTTTTNYTFSNGSDTTINLLVNSGDSIVLNFLGGDTSAVSTLNEVSFELLDSSSTVRYSSGSSPFVGVHYADTVFCSSCLVPVSLSANPASATSAILDWTEQNSATEWEIEYGASGFPQGVGNVVHVTTAPPYTLSGLTASTNYDFYVRSICGASDTSSWSMSGSFSTPCPSVTAPYMQDFEASTTSLPSCWEQGVNNNEDWEFTNTGSGNHIGNNGTLSGSTVSGGYFAYVDDSSPQSLSTELYTPFVDVSSLTVPRLTFYTISDNEGDSNVDFHVDVWDGAQWNDSLFFADTNSLNGAWEKIVLDLSALTITGDIRVRFVVDEVNGFDYDDDRAIDDIVIEETPTCLEPNSLIASNVQSSSADLNWTEVNSASEWEVEYGTAGFTQGSGTKVYLNVAPPYNISGLSSNTTYDFYVRSICTVGDTSAWSLSSSFTTPCVAISSFPYTENFDGSLTNGVWDCWKVIDADNDGDTWNQDDTYLTPRSGAWVAHGMGNNDDHLISPQFTIPAGKSMRMKVWDIVESASYPNDYSVLVSTTGTAISDFTDTLATYSVTNTTWTERVVDLSAYSGVNIYISFWQFNSGSSFFGFGIDDFTFEEIPSCLPVTSLSASTVTSTSADLNWVENNSATEWEIEYGTTGFTQGTGTVVHVTSTLPYSLSGLSANTSYDYYVRSICAVGDTSAWSSVGSFSTCPVGTVCGTYSAGDISTDRNFNSIGDFPSSCPDSLLIVVPAGNRVDSVSTTYDMTAQSGAWMSEQASMLYSPTTMLGESAVSDGAGTTAGTYSYSRTGLTFARGATDTVVFEMHAGRSYGGSGCNTTYNKVDNGTWQVVVYYSPLPSCIEPTMLADSNVQATSVYLNWVENNSATEWIIEYDTAGFTPGTGDTVHVTTAPPYQLTGLSSQTEYDWYVRSICSVGDTSALPFHKGNFTTPCTPFSATYTENFDAATAQIPFGGIDCWSIHGPGAGDIDLVSSTDHGEPIPSGPNAVELNDGNWSSNDTALLVSPQLSDLPSGLNRIRMKVAFESTSPTAASIFVGTTPDPSDMSKFTIIDTLDATDIGNVTSFVEVVVNLDNTSLIGLSEYIAFAHGPGLSEAYIDDFIYEPIPSCLNPDSLHSLNITANSADLAWNDPNSFNSGWEIEYGPTGFTQGNGTIVSASTNPYSLSGLSSYQTYDFYVRTICSRGDTSSWSAMPHTFTVGLPLAGVYTIDSSQATGGTNFQSFTVFANAANALGVSAPVIVNVAPGVYNNQMSLNDIPGSSSSNPIVVNGHSPDSVTITHDQSIRNSTITLERVQYVQIKNLTIEATATSDAWGVHIFDSSHHISIDSNKIVTPIGSNTDVAGIMLSGSETSDLSSGTNGDFISISNNEIIGGERGVSAYGDFSTLNRALLIENNVIHSADDYGVYIYYYDSVAVRGNRIDNLMNTGSDALYMSDVENFEVSGNYLVGQDNGMDANDLNFNNPVTSNSLIFNNMFIGGDDGAYFDDAEEIDFFHNSFRGEDYGIYVNDHLDWDVRNNIFFSNSTYAFYTFDSLAITMDYNIYHTNGTNLIYYGSLYSDLAAFQSGVPSLNINSLQGDPMFAAPVDLHLNGTLANDVGDNSVGITIDIDGDTRPLSPSTTVDIGADEYNPPTCPNVTALIVDSVSSSSISFSWTLGSTETEWQVEYGLTGFTQGSGTFSTVNTNPNTTISGLSSNTQYDFYVRAICAVGDTSSWSFAPLSAFTSCTRDSLPFVDDFSSGVLSQCWTISDPSYVSIESSCDNRSDVIDINYENEAITPVIKAAAAQSIEVGYYIGAGACINDPEDTEHFYVEYWDGTQWVIAKDYDGSMPEAFVWETFVIPPGSYTDSFMVKFNMIDGSTDAWQIDSVVIKEGPSCVQPSNLTAANLLANSVDLNWVHLTGSEWQVQYDTAGFTLGTGIDSITTSSSLTISTLQAESTYDWYVRTICAPGDTSAWTSIQSFTTPCAASVAPYTENFDNLPLTSPYTDLPNCWEEQQGPDFWEVTNDVTNTGHTYLPNIGDHTTGSANYMWIDASGDITGNAMITPLIDMSNLTLPYAGFWFASNNTNNSINHTISLDAWDGSAWVNVATETGNFNSWTEVAGVVPSTIPTTTKFRIQAIANPNGTASDYYFNDLGVDDFFVIEGPTCPNPSNLSYTPTSTTSADISWTSPTSAANAIVEYGTAGFSLGAGTQIISTSTTESITGLMANHTYEAYVKDSCAVGDTSSWVGPIVFGGEVVPCDDFDSYNAGNAASQSILINGWGGTVAGGGDAEFSTDYASSGTQSLKIYDSGTNTFSDVVAEFDTYNSGTWNVAVDVYVPATYGGYYNILHDYTPASQVWAIEVTLDANGTATVVEGTNGTNTIGTYTYNTGAWNTIEHIIDLDNDTAYIRVNGVNTNVGWQFSLGSTNFGDQFNAMNFYSTAPSGQTPLVYFDNFCVTEVLPHYPIGLINTEDANGDADSVNVECSISGTVVGYDRRGGGGYEFALVDLSSGFQEGITVFDFNDVSGYSNPTEGDSLLIFGSVDQFRGLTQFRPDSIVVLGTGTVPMPDTATTLDETTESILVQMNDWVLLDSTRASGSYNLSARSLDSSTTITIRIDSDSEISDSLAVVGNGWVAGDTICSLVGVGGQYDFNSPYLGDYQVFPSLYADVTVCKLSTGIKNVAAKAKSINIYPNPTVGQFTVKSSGLNNDNAIITVRDISGRVVLQDNIARSNSPFTKQYDLNGKAKGLYFISIIDGEERINQKLIVQ